MKFIILTILVITKLTASNEHSYVKAPYSCHGRMSHTGITFRNQEAMINALNLGQNNKHNPFVVHIGSVIFGNRNHMTSATTTCLEANTYLMCKHTADALSKRYQELGDACLFFLKFGDTVLSGATQITACPHPDEDFAVVKIICSRLAGPTLPNDSFLPIIRGKKISGETTAYLASYAEVHCTGEKGNIKSLKKNILPQERTLSFEKINISESSIYSDLQGTLPTSLIQEMYGHIKNINASDQKAILNIKQISTKGVFFQSKDHPLAATCMEGCHGSPLIIDKNGFFYILGIMHKELTRPSILFNGLPDSNALSCTEPFHPSQIIPLTHKKLFINLQPYAKWIKERVEELKQQ